MFPSTTQYFSMLHTCPIYCFPNFSLHGPMKLFISVFSWELSVYVRYAYTDLLWKVNSELPCTSTLFSCSVHLKQGSPNYGPRRPATKAGYWGRTCSWFSNVFHELAAIDVWKISRCKVRTFRCRLRSPVVIFPNSIILALVGYTSPKLSIKVWLRSNKFALPCLGKVRCNVSHECDGASKPQVYAHSRSGSYFSWQDDTNG